MRKTLRLFALASILLSAPAIAGPTPTPAPISAQAPSPVSIAVGTTTQRVPFSASVNTYPVVAVENDGTVEVFCNIGNAGVVADTNAINIQPGQVKAFWLNNATNLACITATGTGSIRALQYTGAPSLTASGGGNSGGGGGPSGNVTIISPFGRALMANSIPVTIAADQTPIGVSASALPLPSGASTAANQTTGNNSLGTIATNTGTTATNTGNTAASAATTATNTGNTAASAATTASNTGTIASQGATANSSLASILSDTDALVTQGVAAASARSNIVTNTGNTATAAATTATNTGTIASQGATANTTLSGILSNTGGSLLGGFASLSVTNASSNVAFPALASPYAVVTLYNAGPNDLYFKQGNGTVTASTADTLLPAFGHIAVAVTGTNVAAITAGADTASLRIYQATAPVQLGMISQPGGGGGSCTPGCVTSVGLAMPVVLGTVGGSPVTSTGTLSFSLSTQTPNTFFAGPTSGGSALPTFRDLVGADLPLPGISTLGGVRSKAAVAHNVLTSISSVDGSVGQTQLSFSDLLGTLDTTQCPLPTASQIGCVESLAPATHFFLRGISTAGVVTAAQPDFADLTGTASPAQLPLPTATTLGGTQSKTVTTNFFLTGISTAGVVSAAQPAFSNLSGNITAAQMLALPSANLYVGNGSGVPAAVALTGDCTISNAGAMTCTKTNGTAFAAIATSGSANDLVAGVVPANRGGAGTTNGILKCNGAGVCSAAVPLTDYAPAGSVVVTATSQVSTVNQFGTWSIFVVTAGGQTITIPASSTLNNQGGLAIFANGGNVTIQSTSPDTINGGTTGGSVVCAAGVACYVTTDGAGHLFATPLTGGGGGGGTPGGSSGQVQYNAAGAFGGITGVTSDGASMTFSDGNFKLSGATSGTAIIKGPATGGGTFTFPVTASDTIGTIAATQTLTNKTISGAFNTITNVSLSTGVTGALALTSLATQVANTVVMNATGSAAAPTAVAIPSCSTTASALTYNTTTHAWGCNTIAGSGTVNSGTAGQLAYYATTGTAISGNASITLPTGTVTLVGRGASVVTGNCAQWDASGNLVDSGGTCGGGGGGPAFGPQAYVGGALYTSPYGGSLGSSASTANNLYFMPFFASQSVTFTDMTIDVGSSVTGNCELGIYTSSGGLPGALVIDAGNVPTGTTGLKTITGLTINLSRGMYFLAMVCSAAPSIYAFPANQIGSYLLGWSSGTTPPQSVQRYSISQTYGALPGTVSGPFTTGTFGFAIWLNN